MKVSKPVVLITAVLFVIFFSDIYTTNAQAKRIGINKVVIDAGHGGTDPGAVYKQYREKDVTLAVALRLGELIRENYSDVEVLFTRTTDVLIPLAERGDIANRAGADLFISIHVNSAKSSAAAGTEVLVMGMDKAGKNLDVAMRENDVITYEKDYQTKYEGYQPGDAESFIIFSLMQYSYQNQSWTLADMVQKHFTKNTNMKARGVKQAPVLVLWRAAMPSILTEFGFISNPEEARYVNSKSGREMYARCIFNAFSEYKTRTEGRGTPIVLDKTSVQEDEQEDSVSGQPKAGTPSDDVQSAPTGGEKVVYRVQVASSETKIPKNSSRFGVYRGDVTEKIIQNRYKYFVGCTDSYKEALSLQAKIRQHIQGAFVVPFAGETPIPMEEARRRQ